MPTGTPSTDLPEGTAPAVPVAVLGAGQIPHPVTGEPTTFDAVVAEYTEHKALAADLDERAKAERKSAEALHEVVLRGWMERQWKTGPQTPAGTPYLHTEWNPKKRQGVGTMTVEVDGEPREIPVPADESDEAFKERAIRAFDEAGLGDKAGRSYAWPTLKSLFKSWRDEGIEPPAPLAQVFDYEPKREVRVRRPPTKKAQQG